MILVWAGAGVASSLWAWWVSEFLGEAARTRDRALLVVIVMLGGALCATAVLVAATWLAVRS